MFVLLTLGCKSNSPIAIKSDPGVFSRYQHSLDVAGEDFGGDVEDWVKDAQPRSSLTEIPDEFWDLSLEESLLIALNDTKILRSLNANVLFNPQAAPSNLDPAVTSSDPIVGTEAALAQFDANVAASLIYSNNDDVFNNPILSGGAAEVQQDLTVGSFNINKTAATGTRFDIQSNVTHDNTNNPTVLFGSSFTTLWQASVRQPLLQGRGVRFNQIAGPNGTVGLRFGTGILISRINHDISIVQFERSVQQMVNEIINAYWTLELAYRNFDSIKQTRDGSLKTWNIAKARRDNGLVGGEADRESQAREQYYLFQAQLLAALNGDPQNGISGILQAESDLRRLLNLPQSDQALIRPADQPIMGQTVRPWHDLADLAMTYRTEIREQRQRVNQRKLEYEAALNFTLPRLDAIATYRNNGFGDDLINGGGGQFVGAVDNAIDGDYDEWEVGFTLDVPVGLRQAHAGLRNTQLQLSREKALLKEQQRQVLHDLGGAVRQVDQNRANIELAKLRSEAAVETVEARFAAYEADAIGFDELLDAQSRMLTAQLAYFNAITNYELSRNDLYLQSGRLLIEHGVALNECDSCF